MSFRAPEGHRVRRGKLATTAAMKNSGVFTLPGNEMIFDGETAHKSPIMFVCVASDADFWETVAVCVQRPGPPRLPTIDELISIRQLFWPGSGDEVFIYLPSDAFKPDGAMVATLWSKPGFAFPTPPAEKMGLEKKNLIQKLNDLM